VLQKLNDIRKKIEVPCPKAQTVTIVAEASSGEETDFTGVDDRELEPDECFVKNMHGGIVGGHEGWVSSHWSQAD
jgi:hypothetical protein